MRYFWKALIVKFFMNTFFCNLDIRWRSYEFFSLPKSSYPCLAFFYFQKMPLILYSFKLLLSWILNLSYHASFLDILVSNVFATVFSYEQKWTSHLFWFLVLVISCLFLQAILAFWKRSLSFLLSSLYIIEPLTLEIREMEQSMWSITHPIVTPTMWEFLG